MKVISGLMLMLILSTLAFAQDQPSSNDIIAKMKVDLDLQEDQVTNITPIIERYTALLQDLQKSIDDGTINQSAISSQKLGLEANETQELSAYLKPDQLSRWRNLQNQIYQEPDKDDSEINADSDEYSNLPKNAP